jgi:hypothetical protein
VRYLRFEDVGPALVDGLWDKVKGSGSYYSIGDGVTKAVFSKMLFDSALVLGGIGATFRIEKHKDFVEIHPMVFSHEFFGVAKATMEEFAELAAWLFAKKRLCCIIPDGLRGAKRLARLAGFSEGSKVERKLSGVSLVCSVYEWGGSENEHSDDDAHIRARSTAR